VIGKVERSIIKVSSLSFTAPEDHELRRGLRYWS
jgi:hypothetical protein